MTAPRIVALHGVQSSRTTWWRVGADLTDLGYAVTALDLPGHGTRPAGPTTSLAALATDVIAQCDALGIGRIDLLAGHSLGAVTALTLTAAYPDRVARVLAEDPPGGAGLDPTAVADSIARDVAWARSDPDTKAAAVAADNPLWAPADVTNDVANLQAVDVDAVTGFLRTSPLWDTEALVIGCPVPVHLLLARGSGTALSEPVRGRLLAALDPSAVTEVDSGHCVHRDRPGAWVGTVVRLLPRS